MSGADLSRRALLSAAIAGLPLARSYAADSTRIVAPAGTFKGRDRGLALAFLGIRYGMARRFQPPEPVADAQTALPAFTFGPSCPQPGARYAPQEEDCLFLNVWKPARSRRNALWPVMVYFHGGAYSSGSVVDPLTDGANLAARGDVVVVTVNHRLNAFGYLYLPDRFPDSGNLGQLDLVLALQWVRRNIAAFGGDPGNVTLFGQSGGGAKIATLMAMPTAAGLFHKAITMSGQQITVSGPMNARRRASAFMEQLKSDPATAPMQHLVGALEASDPILGGGVYMGPVLDMRSLTRHPFYPDAPPHSKHIPMMLGNTIAETRAFIPPNSPKLDGLDWSSLAERLGPELRIDIDPAWVVAQFRSRYPQYSPLTLFYAATTTARSWRGQIIEAEERARAGAPAFVYQLDFENAAHTDDIDLAFGTTQNPSVARYQMSEKILQAFVLFARSGEPGWPPYTLPGRATMVFDVNSRIVQDPRRWERELFARVPYIQPGS